MQGNFLRFFVFLLTFFKFIFFKKLFQEHSQNPLSVLIWLQTVCKGNQQTTKVRASKERAQLPYSLDPFLPKFYYTQPISLSLKIFAYLDQ